MQAKNVFRNIVALGQQKPHFSTITHMSKYNTKVNAFQIEYILIVACTMRCTCNRNLNYVRK